MPNMKNVIRKHNSKIMKNPAPSTTKTCNYCRKTDCPMDGNSLSEYLVYKASVTMVLVKIISKNVTISITVILEISLVKRILNCPNMY